MVLPYHDYLALTPSAVNNPYAGHWEKVEDWPKTFTYNPTYSLLLQAPSATQAYYTSLPNSQATYYWPGNGTTQPAGYYYQNGQYYGATPPPAATGWPYFPSSSSSYNYYYPTSSYPSTYTYSTQYSYPSIYSQAFYSAPSAAWPSAWPAPSAAWPTAWPAASTATAAATAAWFIAQNTALAQAPTAPMYFVGSNPAEIAAQNAALAAMLNVPIPGGNQLIPFKPSTNPQFWCKELDGSWTLREQNDIIMGEIGPGAWEKHPTSGYHYFVRAPA